MKHQTKRYRSVMKKNGFTFVELIVYVAIVSIVMVALITFAWDVISGSTKSSTQQEVFSQSRYISERIKYEIRRASGITSVSPTSISLTNFSPDSTTVIDLSGGNIRINKNGVGAVNLNSSNTTIPSLVFTNYTSGDSKTKNIQFTFTINAAYGSGTTEYTETTSIRSAAEVRSN